MLANKNCPTILMFYHFHNTVSAGEHCDADYN